MSEWVSEWVSDVNVIVLELHSLPILLTRSLMKLLSLFRIEREIMMITFATEISLLNFHYSTYVSHIYTRSRLNMYRKINILIVFISQLTAALMILGSLLFYWNVLFSFSTIIFVVLRLLHLSCLQIAVLLCAMSRRRYHFCCWTFHIHTAAFCWFNKNSAILFV